MKIKPTKKTDKIDYSSTFQQDIEMMRYFQDEFMFRHKHYWDILIKFFTLTVIISILPIASQVFGIELNTIPHRYLLCFPTLGLIVSVISLIIQLGEANKMRSANEAKYYINKHHMDPKYRYKFYDDVIGTKDTKKSKWLSFRLPWLVFSVEILIILGICIIILFS